MLWTIGKSRAYFLGSLGLVLCFGDFSQFFMCYLSPVLLHPVLFWNSVLDLLSFVLLPCVPSSWSSCSFLLFLPGPSSHVFLLGTSCFYLFPSLPLVFIFSYFVCWFSFGICFWTFHLGQHVCLFQKIKDSCWSPAFGSSRTPHHHDINYSS